ncbi:MAG: hypothetical protein H6943_10530 [Zoogloeaceae bacterium]|nr:hypothetical protein [Zoogloeaceae bacterium]
MNFDRSDFSRIQLSLATALLMIGVGAALVWLSNQQLADATQSHVSANRQLNEFEGKLRQVRAEEDEIKKKSALFSSLQSRGIIGQEKRLDWVELIKDIKESRKLLDIEYEFAPQQTLEQAALPGFSFRSSAMRLHMKLLHEGDLLNFINDLRNQAKAYVRVRNCLINRIPRTETGTTEVALLDAICQLDWYTILPEGQKP